MVDEAERSLHDALSVLSQTVSSETRVVYGGGCAEMIMSSAVERQAVAIEGLSISNPNETILTEEPIKEKSSWQ